MFGAIEAGKAYLKYFLDDKELKKGLRGIGTRLQNIGKIGMAATAPLIAGFTAATAAFVSTGSALQDMSQRTGLNVRSLSELKFAAEQSGAGIENVERALRKMAKDGLDVNTFDQVAASIAAIEDPTQRAKAAMDAFGKSGTSLIPMIMDLDNLRQSARDAGVVMDSESAAAADKLGDALDLAKTQVMSMASAIGGAVAGPLTSFLEIMKPILAAVIGWVKNNSDLLANFAAIAAAVAAWSAATYAVGAALTFITLHPIIAFLALLAGALVTVVALYKEWAEWSSKVAENLVNEVDVISATNPAAQATAGPVATGIDAIAADAAKLQDSIKAGGGGVGAVLDQGAIDQIDKILGEALDRTADATEKSAEYLARIVQLIISGRGGGLLAGGD